jgi:hypothetical protein
LFHVRCRPTEWEHYGIKGFIVMMLAEIGYFSNFPVCIPMLITCEESWDVLFFEYVERKSSFTGVIHVWWGWGEVWCIVGAETSTLAGRQNSGR